MCSRDDKKETRKLMRTYTSLVFESTYAGFVELCEIEKHRLHRPTKAVVTLIILFKLQILPASPEKYFV